ncbi:MAG: hypothetical protein DI552_00145 [Brevundimonas sp.]|nr:MAG: hypothetical protein DI552_00145 [Brevundimonas sp.]
MHDDAPDRLSAEIRRQGRTAARPARGRPGVSGQLQRRRARRRQGGRGGGPVGTQVPADGAGRPVVGRGATDAAAL